MPHDHTTWFREVFFSGLDWRRETQWREHANIRIDVVILGKPCGLRTMRVDHRPARENNHSAPTTHLHYDWDTRARLLDQDLTGHTIRLTRYLDEYSFEIL